MNTLPMPKNPAWHFYPETGEVKHIRSGVIALTFTMNKRRLAKITTSSGTEVLVEVPAALPPGLLPIPKYPEYGFSQAEGKVYRVQGGWATFIPRALVPHRKKSCSDYYVWLIPSKGMGDKRQVSLARIAKAIAEQQGLSYAWLRLNLPGSNHSGHPVAIDPEPTGAQHGASQHGTLDADLQHPDTTVCPRPKFLMDRDDARLRLPLLGGWYWWRASEMSRATRLYVTDGGKQAFTQDGWPSVPFDMGGEWGYRAPDPTEPKPAPCEGDLHPEPGNLEQETGNRATELVAVPDGHSNPIPEPAYLPGTELDKIYDQAQQDPEPAHPFDLTPTQRFLLLHENQPGWAAGREVHTLDLADQHLFDVPEINAGLERAGAPIRLHILPQRDTQPPGMSYYLIQSVSTLPSPFDLYPEGDPRWTEGEPETVETPAPAPVFQPRIF